MERNQKNPKFFNKTNSRKTRHSFVHQRTGYFAVQLGKQRIANLFGNEGEALLAEALKELREKRSVS